MNESINEDLVLRDRIPDAANPTIFPISLMDVMSILIENPWHGPFPPERFSNELIMHNEIH